MFIHFDIIHERDRWTLHDSIASHDKKTEMQSRDSQKNI